MAKPLRLEGDPQALKRQLEAMKVNNLTFFCSVPVLLACTTCLTKVKLSGDKIGAVKCSGNKFFLTHEFCLFLFISILFFLKALGNSYATVM